MGSRQKEHLQVSKRRPQVEAVKQSACLFPPDPSECEGLKDEGSCIGWTSPDYVEVRKEDVDR